MSSDVVISVEGLGKKYRIRHQADRPRYTALRDVLAGKARSVVRGPWSVVRGLFSNHKSEIINHNSESSSRHSTPATRHSLEDFWALREVSFEVKQGEVLGIIGRNGAGKSTLLKILSRITEPTEGRVRIKGRVASLLEVGTGFHPELTGRENIFLNGAILGMTRVEIKRKFDEIVAFAEVEKFLDTPVKRYSSGMYVRLAFAVAAHLEPQVLVVDEVLAVGDAEFQKKCLGKMGEVATKEGRTILFVSHNLAAVSNLCTSAILLTKGKVSNAGTPTKIIECYVQRARAAETRPLTERFDRYGSGSLRFLDVEILDQKGAILESIACGQNIGFRLRYKASGQVPVRNVTFSIGIYSILGHFLLFLENEMAGTTFETLPDEGDITCAVPRFPLAPGSYDANIHVAVNGVVADWVKGAIQFDVTPGDYFGSGKLPPETHGGFLSQQSWKNGS